SALDVSYTTTSTSVTAICPDSSYINSFSLLLLHYIKDLYSFPTRRSSDLKGVYLLFSRPNSFFQCTGSTCFTGRLIKFIFEFFRQSNCDKNAIVSIVLEFIFFPSSNKVIADPLIGSQNGYSRCSHS